LGYPVKLLSWVTQLNYQATLIYIALANLRLPEGYQGTTKLSTCVIHSVDSPLARIVCAKRPFTDGLAVAFLSQGHELKP